MKDSFNGNFINGTYDIRIDGPINNVTITSIANFIGC